MIDDLVGAAVGLKAVPRQGWASAGIGRPESVADHSYSAAVMAMALGDLLGLDTQKLVRMALLHDLPESSTGDIVPGQMPRGEKAALEDAAMESLLAGLPEGLGGRYAAVWAELRAGESPEARLMHEIDRLEMAAQAAEYAGRHGPERMGRFFASAREAVATPALRRMLDAFCDGACAGRGGKAG